MKFKLSRRSLRRLEGVHPDLRRVVRAAIKTTEVDFGVIEGVRSLERQRELKASGASQTLRSRHLRGADGFGHAVDLSAFVGPRVSWEFPLYFKIAEAMRRAAAELEVPIRWGGCWNCRRFDRTELPAKKLVELYVEERRAAGRSAFLDGPHFELPAGRRYPGPKRS